MNNKKLKMTLKLQKMINVSKKVTRDEFKTIIKYLDPMKFGVENIDYLLKEGATRNLNYTVNNNKLLVGNNWVRSEYRKELNRINTILSNESIREKVGMVRILAYGPTGTGKTTLLEEIGRLNKNYEFEKMNLETMLSSKMGQTQINILTLATKINAAKNPKIFFIDEIDSIISSRDVVNDVGEHARIVSTFIKFLDSLNKDIIVMAATNLLTKIDKSIVRRFNIKISSRWIDADSFFAIIKDEVLDLSMNEVNFLKSGLRRNEFTISEADDFLKFAILEKQLNARAKSIEILLEFLKDDLKYQGASLSKRKKALLKKVGINAEYQA